MNTRTDIIAERLRLLRNSRGLSTAKLAVALEERYPGTITEQTIKNYEARSSSSKHGKNLGMSVDKLIVFSEFYNVSTDFILGLDDDYSRKPVATKELGLSPATVKILSDRNRTTKRWHPGFDALLSRHDFLSSCIYIGRIMQYLDVSSDSPSELSYNDTLEKAYNGDIKAAEYSLSSSIQRNAEKQYPGLRNHIKVLIGSQAIEYFRYMAQKHFTDALNAIIKERVTGGND